MPPQKKNNIRLENQEDLKKTSVEDKLELEESFSEIQNFERLEMSDEDSNQNKVLKNKKNSSKKNKKPDNQYTNETLTTTNNNNFNEHSLPSLFQRLNNSEIKYRDERSKILKNYIVGKIIGEGSYGKVKEGIDSITKKRVAIKVFNRQNLRKVTGGEASIQREISIIESLKHKNIISHRSHFLIDSKQKLYLVLEYMGYGSLSAVLEKLPNKRLDPYQARKLFNSIISGLEYLKQMSILHRDIKPDNLLINIEGEIKISDFGVAERLNTSTNSKDANQIDFGETIGVGSPAFQAPELITSPQLGKKKTNIKILYKSDIWSAGIVLYEFYFLFYFFFVMMTSRRAD